MTIPSVWRANKIRDLSGKFGQRTRPDGCQAGAFLFRQVEGLTPVTAG